MLVLTLRCGDRFKTSDGLDAVVKDIRGSCVRLAVNAPKETVIKKIECFATKQRKAEKEARKKRRLGIEVEKPTPQPIVPQQIKPVATLDVRRAMQQAAKSQRATNT
jgi:sRNA-binding carbon storage regulator CsrA